MVRQVDITPQHDLVIGYSDAATAAFHHDRGYMAVIYPGDTEPTRIP